MEQQLELQKAQERQETLTAQKHVQHRGQVNMDFDRALLQARQNLLEQQSSLTNDLKERTKKLWQRIEASIKAEEERVAARLEVERKAKAEEERKQKEAELKKRIVAEKLLQEETARKKAAEERRQAQEEKERREQEELSKQKKLEEEQSKREDDELELRRMLNLSTRSDDWRVARTNLHVRCARFIVLVFCSSFPAEPQIRTYAGGKGRQRTQDRMGQITTLNSSQNRPTHQ